MAHPIMMKAARAVQAKLLRNSIKNAAEWALTYRIIGGKKWTFARHPWLYEPHTYMGPEGHAMKAAQIGFTEYLMNLTFMLIDILGESVLYALPDGDSAKDFSAGRFDPALQENKILRALFSDTKNVGMKRAGIATLYVRGARSRSKLKSIPTAGVIMDEIDEWLRAAIDLALERSSGQLEKWIRSISTPSIAGHGVHRLFEDTTQSEFMFKCKKCNQYEMLTFDPNDEAASSLIISTDDPTSPELYKTHLRCKKTNLILPHEEKLDWLALERTKYIPKYQDRITPGWHCGQLYSHTVAPWELAKVYLSALGNPGSVQEFWNNKMGMVHTEEGCAVTIEDLQGCQSNHQMGPHVGDNLVTMGIDVGSKYIHVEINAWYQKNTAQSHDINESSVARLLLATKVTEWSELDYLMSQYNVNYAVVDAGPEYRPARDFCNRWYGKSRRCFFAQGGGKVDISAPEDGDIVTVNRTMWLDQALSRFKESRKTIALPIDTPMEYKDNIRALVRSYKRNEQSGEMTARYVSGSADHYGFSRLFSEVALALVAGKGVNRDIQE